jgi:hypothetical protein
MRRVKSATVASGCYSITSYVNDLLRAHPLVNDWRRLFTKLSPACGARGLSPALNLRPLASFFLSAARGLSYQKGGGQVIGIRLPRIANGTAFCAPEACKVAVSDIVLHKVGKANLAVGNIS